MIRKFATACVLPSLVLIAMLTAAAAVHAQQTPAAPPPDQPTQTEQQPQGQSSSSQEAAPEEVDRPVKKKVQGYEKWTSMSAAARVLPMERQRLSCGVEVGLLLPAPRAITASILASGSTSSSTIFPCAPRPCKPPKPLALPITFF